MAGVAHWVPEHHRMPRCTCLLLHRDERLLQGHRGIFLRNHKIGWPDSLIAPWSSLPTLDSMHSRHHTEYSRLVPCGSALEPAKSSKKSIHPDSYDLEFFWNDLAYHKPI